MAAKQTITQTPEVPPTALRTFGASVFGIKVTKGLPIPESVPAHRTNPNALFFKDFYDAAEHNDHVFLPTRFWTASKEEGGRGVDPKKATVSYVKTKIRDALNDWKKKTADEKPDPRANANVIVVARKEGETMGPDAVAPEDGVSIFFQLPPVEA